MLDPEVGDAFDAAIKVLQGFGCAVQPVSIPHVKYALGAEIAILTAEAAAYQRSMMRTRAEDVSGNVRRELDAGSVVLATDYLLGQRVRRIIVEEFAAALRSVDILATPTIPIPAPRIGQTEVEIAGNSLSVLNAIWRNAYQTNLTGSPTLCMPSGFSQAGLPLGIQLIGRNFDELTLLRVGRCYQMATDWHERMPPCARSPEPR
jgi:aspartyl-tRNA(Asn)/glutamyl-tRNA(Gln) amidotransferase subunit A